MDCFILTIIGGLVLWSFGPKDHFPLLYCIFMTGLMTYMTFEKNYTACMWTHEMHTGRGGMICREF
jgi:hypothetical protein